MSRVKLFLDLDGTLLDPRDRLYDLFTELVPGSTLSRDSYWMLKRSGVGQAQLLVEKFNYSEQEIKAFQSTWLEMVEEPHRLRQDKLFEGSKQVLEALGDPYELVLITNRQSKQLALKQLHYLEIDQHFETILITEHRSGKADLIKAFCTWAYDDIIIGDTPEDVETGKQLGIHTVALSSGMFDKSVLKMSEPEVILDNINSLPSLLDQVQWESTT